MGGQSFKYAPNKMTKVDLENQQENEKRNFFASRLGNLAKSESTINPEERTPPKTAAAFFG